MNRPTLVLPAALTFASIFIVASSTWCIPAAPSGQTQPPGQSAPPLGPASATPTQTANQEARPAASPATSTQPPAKKVWTNDDVDYLRDQSVISTVGNARHHPTTTPHDPAPPSGGNNARSYREQIEKLQTKVTALNVQIAQLKAALNGQSVNSVRHLYGVEPDDLQNQLERLEKQRDDVQAKMEALRDEARHSGIPARQLP
jgi:outer membrane murein-binding lipoprotein Lpp